MRDCYHKFWKIVLLDIVPSTMPHFSFKETASTRNSGHAPSSPPVRFVSTPVDKLTFTIEFAAPGKQDRFEANCAWSEVGRVGGSESSWKHEGLLSESTFAIPSVKTSLQSLSEELGDKPRVFSWHFWEPSVSSEDQSAWQAEFIAEEARVVGDAEARQRVEAAVRAAVVDLNRCAVPWFQRKVDWYRDSR